MSIPIEKSSKPVFFRKQKTAMSLKPKKSTKKAIVFLNPASAAGRTGKRLPEIVRQIKRIFGTNYLLKLTEKPQDAERKTRMIILSGCELVIAVGGDGTIQEVVNGFFDKGKLINPNCRLGILSSGTGKGFAQSMQLPRDWKAQLDLIYQGESFPIDIGKIQFLNDNGDSVVRYFVNEFQAGIGGTVVKMVQTKGKKLGGLFAFGFAALSVTAGYKAQQMHLKIENKINISKKLLGLVVANGAYTGGGMNLTPQARLNDGLLDVLLIHQQTRWNRIKNFPKIYFGKHIGSPEFSYYRTPGIRISGSPHIPLESDGEPLGSLPCKIEVLPAAIYVKGKIERKL